MPIEPRPRRKFNIPSSALPAYVGATFLVTWELIGFYVVKPDIAAATFGEISGSHPFFFLATWAPAIAAFGLVFAHCGTAGIRAFLSRFLLWRCSAGWATFILLLLPLVFVAGSMLKGGPALAPLPPEGVGRVVAALLMMLMLGPIEEFGWRGVMQPLLQRHMAPVWAGLVIGTTWGFWHLPAFFLSSTVYADWNFLPFFIGNVTLAVLVTPIFNSTQGSILWPMLFHWQLINPFWPDAQPWDTIILIAVAIVVVWWNRHTMFTRQGAVTEVVPEIGASSSGPRDGWIRAVLIAAVFAAALNSVAPAMAQTTARLSERLDATLQDFHARDDFPGATAAIALPDGSVATAAAGFADIEAGRAMTPETPMLAASIGKSFVAATVLALENEGRLSRADLLAGHLDDRPWFRNLPNAESITPSHLLHHSAGLPNHVHLPAFQAAWARMTMGDDSVSPEELVGLVTGLNPLFEAGSAWAYSDTGYILLGLVIEKVTEQSYHEVAHDRFLKPLALSGTFASDRPGLAGLAVGYVAPDNLFGLPERTAGAGGRLLWNPAVEWTGGGLASTSHDLARWGHLLFGGTVMAEPYLDRLREGVRMDANAPGLRYGTGMMIIAGSPRGPVYGHGGWIPGYVSSLRHYANHGVTVAFQINTDEGFLDGASDLVPVLEAALADLAHETVR